ncbi:MAG: hypothetical protein LAT81_09885 [Oceanicaulis sp.]|nr:hypothetical protein [Oceanicaulis sp.]
MKFDKLNNATNCDCLQDTFEDHKTRFALKINKSNLRDNDFKTYWEKGRTNFKNCKEACSLQSQSISIVASEKDIEKTLRVYKSLFPIMPKYKPYCAILTFKEKSGKIKLTPTQNNPLHCDFYKSDIFTKDFVELVDTIALENV